MPSKSSESDLPTLWAMAGSDLLPMGLYALPV